MQVNEIRTGFPDRLLGLDQARIADVYRIGSLRDEEPDGYQGGGVHFTDLGAHSVYARDTRRGTFCGRRFRPAPAFRGDERQVARENDNKGLLLHLADGEVGGMG